MTKIAFIGAGSLGFTAGLVRDMLTFPLLEDAHIALMDIDAERLDFAHKTVLETHRGREISRQSDRHPRPGRSAQGCRRGADHHPDRQHRGLAIRYRDPQEIRRGYQRRRHARPLRHLPLPAHPPADDGYPARHGEVLPERRPAQLHQPDGHAVRRPPAPDTTSRSRDCATRSRARP